MNCAVKVRLCPAGSVPKLHGNAVAHSPVFTWNDSPGGGGSVTWTSSASDGPAFAIVIWYCTDWPADAVGGPVFVIDRLDSRTRAVLAVLALLARFVSTVVV